MLRNGTGIATFAPLVREVGMLRSKFDLKLRPVHIPSKDITHNPVGRPVQGGRAKLLRIPRGVVQPAGTRGGQGELRGLQKAHPVGTATVRSLCPLAYGRPLAVRALATPGFQGGEAFA